MSRTAVTWAAANRWGRTMAAALGGVLVLAVTACGVPSSGKPIVDGTFNANGSSGGGGASSGPPGPDAYYSTAVNYVEGYLATLAGLAPTASTNDEIAAAQAWIKPSLCRSTRVTQPCPGAWQPQPAAISVIRAPVGGWQFTHTTTGVDVTGIVQILGTFSPTFGYLAPPPPSGDAATKLTFSVVPDTNGADGHWRLIDAPHVLLMSEDALNTEYTAQPVYFWNTDYTALIPDIRYLPNSLSTLRKATQIVSWVLDGHSSPWLGLSGPLMPGVTLADPTVGVNGNRYVVNLSPSARGNTDQDKLGYQLRWSLGKNTAEPTGSVPSEVQLQVDGQNGVLSGVTAYRDEVPNLRLARADGPAATFGIVGGVVTEFAIDIGSGLRPTTVTRMDTADQPKVLSSGTKSNSGVRLAAVDGTQTAAALVKHNTRTNSDELWVRWYSEGVPTDFHRVDRLPPGTMLRPEFISPQGKSAAVVVAVDGRLYMVAPNATKPVAKLIAVPGTTPITAFSIAPDAHRIAFVSGGRLYLSVLNSTGPISMTAGNMINTAPGSRTAPVSDQPDPVGLDSVAQVGWSAVDKLLISGKRGATTVVDEISADGSSAHLVTDNANRIDLLTSYVYDPLRYPPSPDNLMVQTSKGAFSGRSQSPVLLQLTDANHASLTAPFFQD